MEQEVKEIELTIVSYSLENNTERYVFFFYDNGKLLTKHVEYVVNDDYSSFANKFNQIIEENHFNITSSTIYNVNRDTKMNTIKFPLRKFNNYNKLVNDSLLDRYGSDYTKKYNVSTTVYKGNDNDVFYTKLLESKKSISLIKKITKLINIKKYQIINLSSAIESYFVSQNSKNKIIVFFEASYVIIGCFMNGHIVDLLFLEDNDHIKIENGYSIDIQLNNVEKIILSLIWKYQKNDIKFEAISIFCNSQRKLDKFVRKQNLLNYDLEISETTEIFFVPVKPKNNLLTFGFTLVETVVAFAIFAIVAAIVASLVVFVINQDSKTRLNTKINSYLYNVGEVVRSNPRENGIRNITAYNEPVIDENVHSFYINQDLDYLSPSLSKNEKKYKVDWKYTVIENESSIQDFTVYKFAITGIYEIDKETNLISSYLVEVTL